MSYTHKEEFVVAMRAAGVPADLSQAVYMLLNKAVPEANREDLNQTQERRLAEAFVCACIEVGVTVIKPEDFREALDLQPKATYAIDEARCSLVRSRVAAIFGERLVQFSKVSSEAEELLMETRRLNQAAIAIMERLQMALGHSEQQRTLPLSKVEMADDAAKRLCSNLVTRWRKVLVFLQGKSLWIPAWNEFLDQDLDYISTQSWFGNVSLVVNQIMDGSQQENIPIKKLWAESWTNLNQETLDVLKANLRWSPRNLTQ